MCPPPGIAAHVNGAPLLIACNADVEFPTDGIRDLIALFDEQPSLAILGPRQVTPDARIAHAGILGHGATDGGRDYGQPDHGQHTERILDVAQVSGSVMFIRRQAYHRLGGIPTVSRLYFEDALLCLKARRAGWVVAYSGLRTFTHHVAASPQPVDSSRVQLAVAGAQTFQDALRTQMRTA
jgi:GT2 family glycosyltransferase